MKHTIFFRKNKSKDKEYIYLIKKPKNKEKRQEIILGRLEDWPEIVREFKKFMKKIEESTMCLL